jgi:hypothetical protein
MKDMYMIVIWHSLVNSVSDRTSTEIEHDNQLRVFFHDALFSSLDVRVQLSLTLLRNQR